MLLAAAILALWIAALLIGAAVAHAYNATPAAKAARERHVAQVIANRASQPTYVDPVAYSLAMGDTANAEAWKRVLANRAH